MFRKILIANRGEIACRVIRTARRMGIATVAVYSEADHSALHVEMADEAVAIGPAPAAESYLSIERILEACRSSGAEAVHPGYGFLSENPFFARALDAAGIVFIGPTASAIEAMGDKIQSKKIAAEAGVATVPGHATAVADEEEAVRIAAAIGYPVMIKATAGGGGKGMRIAAAGADLGEALRVARSEARAAFGDDRVFIEKYIADPRHIEVQLLADAHGNIIHLGERECSIQRRNQKIVEEAPSAYLDQRMRDDMTAQAMALARAVVYRSAGTVEFIVDRDRQFYFLEMNTRLQVEHPVTELVTDIDLVEEMIRIAAGERLRMRQEDVRFSGWALEARIYAEDPYRDFLPSIGRLTRYRPPRATSDNTEIRVDSGVAEGSEISIHYDPLIAKLCVHAESRDAATAAMADALDDFELEGVRHNIPFLSALMAHPRWREARLSTSFIRDEYPDGFHGVEPAAKERMLLAAVATSVELADRARFVRGKKRAAKDAAAAPKDWIIALGRENLPVRVAGDPTGRPLVLELAIDASPPLRVETDWRPGQRVWRGSIDGAAVSAQVTREGHSIRIVRRGATIIARLLTPAVAQLASLMPEKQVAGRSNVLLCPMPGLVVAILVGEGRQVQPGETLAIVEAMKMENVLRADRAATISRILVRPGDSLAVDAVIMEFAAAS